VRRLLPFLAGLALVLASPPACRRGEPACPDEEPPAPDPALELVEHSATRVAGRYVAGRVVLTFVTSMDPGEARLELGRPGQPLLEVRGDATHVEVALLGAAEPDPAGGRAGARLRAAPELAAVPAASRALGALGLTGVRAPATLPLHLLAREIARESGTPPPLIDTSACCDDYPNRDDHCLGMCGHGCDCWSWICGDCCYHEVCATHDHWCRRHDWLACVGLVPVIALGRC
jgi:hypothetical protein